MPQSKLKLAAAAAGGVQEKNLRKTAKSRNGCQTCKVKRLKCDETRPSCENCLKRGYDCPGYKKALKWSTKYEVLQPGEPDGIKTFHPSVEYHFSSIDPLSFGQSISTSSEEAIKTKDAHDESRPLSDDMLESLIATHVPPPESIPRLHPQGPYCAWTDNLPSHATFNGQVSVSSASSTSRQSSLDNTENNDQIQAIPQQRSNTPEEIAQWKSLPTAYYRTLTPTMSRALQNDSTALVEHYFRDVCGLYSSFDSKLNPFRTVIARLWDNSSSIFYAIQSMAAAHLANYMPDMGVTGLHMQRKAYECLQKELQLAHVNQNIDDKLLLAVLLLGMSSPWHEPGDLGKAHLDAARALIYPRLLREDAEQSDETSRNNQFFAQALIYWEMCVAFVVKEPLKSGQERPQNKANYNELRKVGTKVMPHPWSGVGPRAQMLFAEVGRLIRNYRSLNAPISYDSLTDQVDVAWILAAAADFEIELVSMRWPAMDDLVDVQDERTGKYDFIMIAEATRCAALLEIYRVFPHILARRFDQIREMSDAGPFIFPYARQPMEPVSDNISVWLSLLARHIVLDLLGSLPFTSGTKPLQLLLLTTAAAELRLAEPVVLSSGMTESTEYDLDIARARDSAMARLQELASRLPSKPVFSMINLIREVWRRYDVGQDVFWLDVMHENRWLTVMG